MSPKSSSKMCRLACCAFLLSGAAGIFLSGPAHAGAATVAGHGKNQTMRFSAPLAPRLQRWLGLRAGRPDYLPAYRGLMAFVFGKGGVRAKVSTGSQLLALVMKSRRASHDLRTIARDFAAGAGPLLLRDKVLAAVGLDGQPTGLYAKKWPYYGVFNRQTIMFIFVNRGKQLAASGKENTAALYMKTAMLLEAQDDALGATLDWSAFKTGLLRQVGITRPVRSRLRRVYHATFKSAQLAGKLYTPMFNLMGRYRGRLRSIPKDFSRGYLGALKANIKALQQASLGLQYRMLQSVLGDRRRLGEFGHTKQSEKIAKFLHAYAKSVRKRYAPSKGRAAVLRWIGQAAL